jgi:hypothetical protein
MKAKSGKATVAPLVWGVFLWICVPAGLFFAGYKLVGPKIGEVPVLKKNAEKLIAAEDPGKKTTAQNATDDPVVDERNGPEVEISVQKATGRAPRRSNILTGDEQPKPKRKRKKAAEPKPTTTHVRDDASGDAAMTGGGDGPSDPAGGGTGGGRH